MREKTIIYKFLDVELDVQLRELRRAGQVVSLQPKVFNLLVYLLQNRSRAVTKDELQDAVWAGTIVSETALSRAIMKARKAVGDDADQQKILKTVHGHGYRFIEDAEELIAEAMPVGAGGRETSERGESEAAAPQASASDFPQSTAKATEKSSGWRVWLAGAMAITLVGIGALLLNRPAVGNSLKMAILPIINDTGSAELDWVPLGLMSLVNRQIGESTGLEMVSASRMVQWIPDLEQGLPEGLLEKLHGAEGVTHVLKASLQREGPELVLQYQVLRPNGQSPTQRVVGANPTQLTQTMIREVLAMLPNAGTRKEFREVSASDFATEAYAKGMALQLEGRVREARDFFEVAVAEDPEAFWPSYELALTMRRLADSAEGFEQALAFTQSLLPIAQQTADVRAEVAVRNAAGRIHEQLGRRDEAKTEYLAALKTARASGEISALPAMLINLAIIARHDREYENARGMLYEAMEINQKLGEPPSGYIQHSLGQIAFSERDYPLAETAYREALGIFRAQNRRREAASSLSALARLLVGQGAWQEADRLIDESLALRRELDSAVGVVDTLLSRAELEGRRQDHERALDAATEALALATDLKSKGRIRHAESRQLDAYLALGQLEPAQDIVDRRRAPLDGEPASFGQRGNQARIAQALGDYDKADNAYQDLYREAVENDNEAQVANVLKARAKLARALNRDDAVALTLAALASARKVGKAVEIGESLLALADWHLDQGDTDAATPLVTELQATLGHWPRSTAIKARLDFLRGQREQATRLMADARARAGNAWGNDAQSWFDEVNGVGH